MKQFFGGAYKKKRRCAAQNLFSRFARQFPFPLNATPSQKSPLKLSVGVSSHPYLLEIEGLFTQGWLPGRTVGESVGGIFEMDSSDWSNGIRYHTFDTRPDTEFKVSRDRAPNAHTRLHIDLNSADLNKLRGTIPSTLRNWGVDHTDLQLRVS